MNEITIRYTELKELAELAARAIAETHQTTASSDLNTPGANEKGGCDLKCTKALASATNAFARLMFASRIMGAQDAKNVVDYADLMVQADQQASLHIENSN